MDTRSPAFRRLPLEEQRRRIAEWRRERDVRERKRMTALGQRPTDLRPRLQKKHGAIV